MNAVFRKLSGKYKSSTLFIWGIIAITMAPVSYHVINILLNSKKPQFIFYLLFTTIAYVLLFFGIFQLIEKSRYSSVKSGLMSLFFTGILFLLSMGLLVVIGVVLAYIGVHGYDLM